MLTVIKYISKHGSVQKCQYLEKVLSLTCFSLLSNTAKSLPCFLQKFLASCHDLREIASEKAK